MNLTKKIWHDENSEPPKNYLWAKGGKLFKNVDGQWKEISNKDGSSTPDSGTTNKVAENFFKFLFPTNQGKISGILKLESDEPWQYVAWQNGGAIDPLPGDTATFYDFATMTDEDIANIYQDLADGGYYMLVRSEPVVENYGDANSNLLQQLYFSDGIITLGYDSNNCYGIKVNGHDCFWYTYYD